MSKIPLSNECMEYDVTLIVPFNASPEEISYCLDDMESFLHFECGHL